MSQQQSSRKSPKLWQRILSPQLAPPWSISDALSTLLALALALFFLSSGLSLALFEDPLSAVSLLGGWTMALIVIIGFVAITRRRRAEEITALRLVAGRSPMSIYLLLGLAVALTLDLAAAGGAGDFRPVPALRGLDGEVSSLLLAFLFVAIVQPIAEGLVFWGVLMPRLRASISPLAGYVIAVALYTGLHLLVYGARLTGPDALWYGLIVPLGMGLFMGAVRITSQSTLAAMVAGFGGGLTAFAVALVVGG